jgi:predicted site-specific integrase-resolvase
MSDTLKDALKRCPAGMAARILGVSPGTLRNWHRAGRLKAERTATGRYLYDLTDYTASAKNRGKGA